MNVTRKSKCQSLENSIYEEQRLSFLSFISEPPSPINSICYSSTPISLSYSSEDSLLSYKTESFIEKRGGDYDVFCDYSIAAKSNNNSQHIRYKDKVKIFIISFLISLFIVILLGLDFIYDLESTQMLSRTTMMMMGKWPQVGLYSMLSSIFITNNSGFRAHLQKQPSCLPISTRYIIPDLAKDSVPLWPLGITKQQNQEKEDGIKRECEIFNGNVETVVVTAIDATQYDFMYLTKLVENRKQYYGFGRNNNDNNNSKNNDLGIYIFPALSYNVNSYNNNDNNNNNKIDRFKVDEKNWNKLELLKSAIASFPKARNFWYLDQDYFITNPNIDITTTTTTTSTQPHLVISYSTFSINLDSFIIANCHLDHNLLFVKSLLDLWTDPLLRRKYQYAEDALSHILKYHETFVNKTRIVSRPLLSNFYHQSKL